MQEKRAYTRTGKTRTGKTGTLPGVWPVAAAFVLSALFLSACSREKTPVFDPANPVQVSVRLSTNSVTVGDVFLATAEITHPRGATLSPPSPADGKNIVLRHLEQETLPHSEEWALTRLRYELTSFRLGEHALWRAPLEWFTAETPAAALPFPQMSIEVRSALAPGNDTLQDIQGTARWSSSRRWLLWGTLGLILALTLATLYILQKKKQQAGAAIPAPPTPPHIVALRALEYLLRRGLIEAKESEPFYVGLSTIVRTYIENRFGLRAPEQTTEEFIYEAVHSRRLTSAHQALLQDFLTQSDLVKFARHEPGQQDMRAAHDTARRFVVETMLEDRTASTTEEVQA